eukprot:14768918-Alexandrium_andersonii.AAC.1
MHSWPGEVAAAVFLDMGHTGSGAESVVEDLQRQPQSLASEILDARRRQRWAGLAGAHAGEKILGLREGEGYPMCWAVWAANRSRARRVCCPDYDLPHPDNAPRKVALDAARAPR